MSAVRGYLWEDAGGSSARRIDQTIIVETSKANTRLGVRVACARYRITWTEYSVDDDRFQATGHDQDGNKWQLQVAVHDAPLEESVTELAAACELQLISAVSSS